MCWATCANCLPSLLTSPVSELDSYPKFHILVTRSISCSGCFRCCALPNTDLHLTIWLRPSLVGTISHWVEGRHLVSFPILNNATWVSNPGHHIQISVSFILTFHLSQHAVCSEYDGVGDCRCPTMFFVYAQTLTVEYTGWWHLREWLMDIMNEKVERTMFRCSL